MNEGGQERTTANDDMAGAGGLEPPNGGIKNRTATLISLRIFPNCGFKRLYRIKGLRANFQLLGARDDGCATHHKSPGASANQNPHSGGGGVGQKGVLRSDRCRALVAPFKDADHRRPLSATLCTRIAASGTTAA